MHFRRVTVDRERFKKTLLLVMSFLVTYLIVWTAVDGPRDEMEFEYGSDEFTILSRHGCSLGDSQVWRSLCFAWECILLVIATVLTFQSYNVMEELNETRYFAFMIYSHFFFLLMRLLTFLLLHFDRISSATQLRIMSILVSCDAIAAIAIYYIPKFLIVKTPSRQKAHITKTPKGTRLISGVKIPAGGIPNLIRPPALGEDEYTSFLSEKTANTN